MKQEQYHTTSGFSSLDKGYKRNCGPTAVTNAILVYEPDGDPDLIYKDVVRIGGRRLTYWNCDLFHHFGGTVDILTVPYLKKAFKAEGIEDIEISKRRRFDKEEMIKAVERGEVLYLQFRHHPRYEEHHAIAYKGFRTDDDYYLKLADGWKSKPVFIPMKELGKGYYISIREKQRT